MAGEPASTEAVVVCHNADGTERNRSRADAHVTSATPEAAPILAATASARAGSGPVPERSSAAYSRDHWPVACLPMLAGIGPLLAGAADKRPCVGDGWPEHPGQTIAQLHTAAPECICWHIGAAPQHIGIDIDGPSAAAFCQRHGCDPYTADTWRIVRTSNTDRLKLVFTVTPEQKAALAAGGKTVKIDGQELAVFAKPGTQIVVLGQHFTKESGFTQNDDQYAWAGRPPADAQPLPPEWFTLLTGVFCGDRPLRPPTRRSVSIASKRGKAAYIGNARCWSNSSQRQPCPMCGRDHSGACSIHQDGDSVWCCHGDTKSAPDCSAKGEKVTGTDGRTWGYVRTEDHDSFGERSLFVLHKPKPKPAPAAPPLNGETFIPDDAPAGDQTPWGQGPEAQPSAPPKNFSELIDQLPDGWLFDPDTQQRKRQQMAVGRLADLLEHHQHLLRFNDLTMFCEVRTAAGWRDVRDADLDSTYVQLSKKGWVIGLDPITKAVCHVARLQTFHPIQQYLLELETKTEVQPFDLDAVAPQFFRATSPLHAAMVRKWLIGAVARAMQPGCQMDYCLVLQSRQQGIRKSTSFRDLASPEWFTSTVPDGDKDFLLNVHSCWIFELAELESVTGKRDAGRLKNLITSSVDMFRVPYGRTAERRKRSSVFCGTVNEDTFLKDETGNRRYWVVPIEGDEPLDRDGLKAARDGIWKAALAAWRAGELPMLSREQELLSEQQNAAFVQTDPWLSMLETAMAAAPQQWRDPFSTADALQAAGLKAREQITRKDETRIAPLLRQLGFEKPKNPIRTGGGRRVRLWCPAQPAQPGTTSNPGGCATPDPLQDSASQRPAQPAQPIRLEGSSFSGKSPAAAAAGAKRSPYVGDSVVPVVPRPPKSSKPVAMTGPAPGTTSPEGVVPQQSAHPAKTFATSGISAGTTPAKTLAPEVVPGGSRPSQLPLAGAMPTGLIGSGADAMADDDDPAWGPRPQEVA